ncbi:zinc-binding alcohol dehydrogenase family protein [Haliangium ochraceum]|uniref:Alcohol dehydrogenase GroES domain protein n=1 Tax=Haliangium ochraceum (strain DSM 14365 / JCM 11303 / SMP-2) TaxID=502025 RepID=D0LWH2_HALO1|nr:zinc-binding alcohol dehydrogenase family protein [Haliangium ochraceum]ACY17622.1 Alcohol dehydrogenase GroES domain protein [Haliangium ochraceum DSM 14365]
MRAYVIEHPGGPEALQLRELPEPEPREGWVNIAVRAFGLNRSEWFTRTGHSPTVHFPRVLGIECVGEVVAAPGTDFEPGERVAAMMGGMGRRFDGSYAEHTAVPREHVFRIDSELPWAVLGALPEMLQTVHGSLFTGLELDREQGRRKTLLIRGGTSSIGLAALGIAKHAGHTVLATTRDPGKRALLGEREADAVIIDEGAIADQVRAQVSGGVDAVLELVGASTLRDSLAAVRRGGTVCMSGVLGGAWALDGFEPMMAIPNGVKLTAYSGSSADITDVQFGAYLRMVETGVLDLGLGPVLAFEDLQHGHRMMDENSANGKIVVVVDPADVPADSPADSADAVD